MIYEERNSKKFIEIYLKRLRKKVVLFKTDYEEGKLQPTLADHPQLATPRASYFLLVYAQIWIPHEILYQKVNNPI
jgi:hypothetical protein